MSSSVHRLRKDANGQVTAVLATGARHQNGTPGADAVKVKA